MRKEISKLSVSLLVLAALFLIISVFVPIWRIDMDAPQYPEGLRLEIWANKIAGDVEIINGLNHYIGMKTLHSEDFIEFTILPYLIFAYALLFLVTAYKRSMSMLRFSFFAFVLFGVVAMIDFWKWEYEYGHNLDPNAAIKVPGMAYQPPLIGFKQLLNFGAYSIPDLGGWLFLSAGALILIALLRAWKGKKQQRKNAFYLWVPFTALVFTTSCGSDGPQPIILHKDPCDYCRMSIADGKFGAELITTKHKVYKFDDISCMLHFKEENKIEVKGFYVHDFSENNQLIEASTAWYVQHEQILSPMGGGVAAFASKENALPLATEMLTIVNTWDEIQLQIPHHHPTTQETDHVH